ncbi:MAG: PTS sugar transporter subunit IIB [Coprobacillaceae bacterium]
MKILLVCCAGMSTSMLVQRMEKAAKEKEIDAQILAVPILEAKRENMMDEYDIVMLGPQVRNELKYLTEMSAGKFPVVLIDMRDYGMMNGEKILLHAVDEIQSFSKS